MRLEFDVQGIPAPKGSTRAFVVNGRAIVTADNKRTKPWANAVAWVAADAHRGAPATGPIEVGIVFRFPRPKGHYRKDWSVKPSAPAHHVVKPDIDKLLRAMLDALTGVVWVDDSQVCAFGVCGKRYVRPGEAAGASVVVVGLETRP